tara:strand:+ start:373 stop:1044 length:672 start_codon:yes stop_codon:yes gene_type:complete
MIFVDIGTCVGLFIDEIYKKYNKDSIKQIHCFEPHKENFRHLTEKYNNDKRVILNNCAVSNFKGTAKFFIKNYNDKYNFVGNAGSTLKKTKRNIGKINFNIVNVIKLSEYIKKNNINKIKLLKIDSEGSEYDIIFDLFEKNIIESCEKIYFEDHSIMVNLNKERKKLFDILNHSNPKILNKFFLQEKNHYDYTPISKYNYNSDIFKKMSLIKRAKRKLLNYLK